MARRGVVVRLVLALTVAGAGWSAGACTRCDIDCAAPRRVESVVAEVRSTDPGIVHVRTEGGDAIDVRVYGGSPDDLEEGTSYRFPLVYLDVAPDAAIATVPADPSSTVVVSTETTAVPADQAAPEASAFFPDDCDCTNDYISDLDGTVIDPGVDIPFRRFSLSFIALSMLAAMGWALARWQKGEPI